MKKKLFFVICLLAMVMSANAQQKIVETVVAGEWTEARMLDVMSKAIFKPLVVELEIAGPREQKEYPIDRDRWMSLGRNAENVQNWATYHLAKDLKCDVIVAASYDVVYSEGNKSGSVTIIGYPANFKNWHSVTTNDLEWILKLPVGLYTTPNVTTVSEFK